MNVFMKAHSIALESYAKSIFDFNIRMLFPFIFHSKSHLDLLANKLQKRLPENHTETLREVRGFANINSFSRIFTDRFNTFSSINFNER